MKDKMFGPQNAEESRVFAEEALLFDVQELISELMSVKSMTQASLAKKMNVSAARVSQILNGEDSLTLRTVANVFFALGEECQILCAKSRSWPKFGIEHVIVVPVMAQPHGEWDLRGQTQERVECADATGLYDGPKVLAA